MKGRSRRVAEFTLAILFGIALSTNGAPPHIANFGPQQIYVGQFKTYTVRVIAYGGPLEYHWWHQEPDAAQGHAIPFGEGFAPNRPRLSVPNALPNRDYNGAYWCVIRNKRTGEASTSPRAQVTVVVAPRITSHPRDQTVPLGGSASFTVQADPGAPVPVKYQWFREGRPIPNARKQTLVLNNVRAAKGGFYHCRVTTIGGSTESGGALLKVTP